MAVLRWLLSAAWLALLWGCSLSGVAATITQAEISRVDAGYALSADIDFALTPSAKEALLKGIALAWEIPIVLKQQRAFWWDQEISRQTLRFQIRYFALLNVYRVKAEHSGQVSNFSSLAAALNSMAVIHALPLVDSALLAPQATYLVGLRVIFNREALPIPLRPTAYLDADWFLSSPWVTCVLPRTN